MIECGGVITVIGSTLLIFFNVEPELIVFLLIFISVFIIVLWFYKKIIKTLYYCNYFMLKSLP